MTAKKILFLCTFITSVGFAVEMPVKENRNYCNVHLWSPQPKAGGRCSFSDVMVGIRSFDPLVILCARLDVQCRDKSTGKEIPVENSLENTINQ